MGFIFILGSLIFVPEKLKCLIFYTLQQYPPALEALSVPVKCFRRKGQEEYELEKLTPTSITPFPHLSILGTNEASLVGLQDYAFAFVDLDVVVILGFFSTCR